MYRHRRVSTGILLIVGLFAKGSGWGGGEWEGLLGHWSPPPSSIYTGAMIIVNHKGTASLRVLSSIFFSPLGVALPSGEGTGAVGGGGLSVFNRLR